MPRRLAPAADSWLGVLDALYAGSWNHQLGRFRSRYAYRGVTARSDVLQSSLARLASTAADPARIELGLLRSFRKYAQQEASHTPDTIWHWLALGQHAGLPTRLIDWTFSPLVALHFATSNADHADRDGEVWCVDFARVNQSLPGRLRKLLENEQSETVTIDMLGEFPSLQSFDRLSRKEFVIFVEPPSLHQRLAAQHALFSLMPKPLARLDGWLQRHGDVYRRVTIPAGLKSEVRDKLDQANINERVLQGDLDGLCRWLTRYYRPAVTPPVDLRRVR